MKIFASKELYLTFLTLKIHGVGSLLLNPPRTTIGFINYYRSSTFTHSMDFQSVILIYPYSIRLSGKGVSYSSASNPFIRRINEIYDTKYFIWVITTI